MKLDKKLAKVGKTVRVLRDRVLVKPLPYVHPVLATPGLTMQKGVVVAVGYGRRQRRKVAFNQQMGAGSGGRTLHFEDGPETGRILPMEVKPGDVVEYSFRNITTVDFDRVEEFARLHVGELSFIWQKAIYSVDPEGSQSAAMLWSQSAGFDRNGNYMSGAEEWHRA